MDIRAISFRAPPKITGRINARLLAAAGLIAAMGIHGTATAASKPYDAAVFAAAARIQPEVVAWRRDIHQHPELSNQEVRTSRLVANQLRALGYEVHGGVAKTGIIAVLHGAKSGRVVALRADMDALPIAEPEGLPFASRATATVDGKPVPVMHACGHDAHVAILLGAAKILASMKADIAGTVILIFQPAEEGPPAGEEGGAPLIMKEGLLAELKPEAVFGLHVGPGEAGMIRWRPGPFLAGADMWELTVTGRQTHGAMPWLGIDAASISADIVTAFNQIVARQLNSAKSPTILSIGEIQLGNRQNIIPGSFEMAGTLRSFDPATRREAIGKIETALQAIGSQYGAKLSIRWTSANAVTVNDPGLVARLTPALERAATAGVVPNADYVMASEDFSSYQAIAPTLYVNLAIGKDSGPNHSPLFQIDERALETGVRAQVLVALDFLASNDR